MAISDVARRIPWTQQPQIAVGVPGALVCVLPTFWGIDLAGNALTSVSGTKAVTSSGQGITNPGSIALGHQATGPNYTLIFVGQGGTPSSNGNLIGSDDGGSKRRFQFRLSTTSGQFQFITFDNANANNVSSTTAAPFVAIGSPYIVIGTQSATQNNIYAAQLNGAISGSGAVNVIGTAASLLSTDPLCIGARGAGLSPYDGTALFACIIPRTLSKEECQKLLFNPWQLFSPLIRRIWAPAASGLPTLSASTYTPGSLSSVGWRPRITAT